MSQAQAVDNKINENIGCDREVERKTETVESVNEKRQLVLKVCYLRSSFQVNYSFQVTKVSKGE